MKGTEMSKEDLTDIQNRKNDLKSKKENGDFKDNEDAYFIKLMDIEDDEMLVRINTFDEDIKNELRFLSNRSKDLMATIGTLQKYNSELAKAKFNKHKANRYKEKVYNERYEFYRLGKGHIQLKNSMEYNVWISKDSRYARTNSYCDTYDILISFLEYAIKHLNNKVFAVQTLMKVVDYNLAPQQDVDREPDE